MTFLSGGQSFLPNSASSVFYLVHCQVSNAEEPYRYECLLLYSVMSHHYCSFTHIFLIYHILMLPGQKSLKQRYPKRVAFKL